MKFVRYSKYNLGFISLVGISVTFLVWDWRVLRKTLSVGGNSSQLPLRNESLDFASTPHPNLNLSTSEIDGIQNSSLSNLTNESTKSMTVSQSPLIRVPTAITTQKASLQSRADLGNGSIVSNTSSKEVTQQQMSTKNPDPPRFRTVKSSELNFLHVSLLGSDAGKYPTIKGMLDKSSIVYSFGIGSDPSWELELLEAVKGIQIHAFDGTPDSSHIRPRRISEIATHYEAHYEEEFENPQNIELTQLPADITFLPWLLAMQKGEILLYRLKRREPDQSKEVPELFSVLTEDSLPKFKVVYTITTEGRTLEQIMKLHGHKKLDLLKLSVNGLEMPLIREWAESRVKVPVCQLLVNFMSGNNSKGVPTWKEGVDHLERLGFQKMRCKPMLDLGIRDKKCVFLSRQKCKWEEKIKKYLGRRKKKEE